MDSNYKFIVTTGCSYNKWNDILHETPGQNPHNLPGWNDLFNSSFDEKFNLQNNVVVISGGLSSSGCKWQHDSSTYIIQKLLDFGIEPQNIFCLVEWSEIMRNTIIDDNIINGNGEFDNIKMVKYQHEQRCTILDNDNKEVYDVGDNEFDWNSIDSELSKLIQSIEISQGQFQRVGKIDNTYYHTPNQTDFSETHNESLYQWWSSGKEWDSLIPTKRLVNKYLDTIIANQNFLKSNNINYRYTFMNSQFSNWTYKGDDLPKLRAGRDLVYKINNDLVFKLYPYTNTENDIESFFPSLKWKFNQIDLTNFYMVTNENFRRGGLDELGITLFNEYVFVGAYDRDIARPAYGNHIPSMLYGNLWKEVTSNVSELKFNDEYLEKIKKYWFEDYNSDERTTNAVGTSKKYIKEKLL